MWSMWPWHPPARLPARSRKAPSHICSTPYVLRTLPPAAGVHVEQVMAPARQQGPRMVVSEEVRPAQILEQYARSVGMSDEGLAEARKALQVC